MILFRIVIGSMLLFCSCAGAVNPNNDPDAGPDTQYELGQSCTLDEDCKSDYCYTQAENPSCSMPCTDEQDCPKGFSCHLAAEADTSIVKICLGSQPRGGLLGDDCMADGDCRTGLCHAQTCSEICTECGPNSICQPTQIERLGQTIALSLCTLHLAKPNITLGPYHLTDSVSDEILLEIPAGLISFSLIAVGEVQADDKRIGFERLINPQNTTLIDIRDEQADSNPYSVPYPDVASTLVPSGGILSSQVRPGTYRLQLGVYSTEDFINFLPTSGQIDQLLAVFEGQGEEGGLLDLNMFFSPKTGIDPDSADTNAFWQNTLAQIESTLFYPVGIRTGQVRYQPVSADYDTISSPTTIRELCRAYSDPGKHHTAANIILVDDIKFTSGFTGGIPGPTGIFGLAGSCIVIERKATAKLTGKLIAHELGHFLGLSHTTHIYLDEQSIYVLAGHDSLADTPQCTSGQLSDCPDYHNLMFPFFPDASLSLTPDQIQVVRRNPILYELKRQGLCPGTNPLVDMTQSGFAAGSSAHLTNEFHGTCGGQDAPERIHLFRQRSDTPQDIELRLTTDGFAPAMYVLAQSCDLQAQQLDCVSAQEEIAHITLSLDSVAPGDYYVVVDGLADKGGWFVLEVQTKL